MEWIDGALYPDLDEPPAQLKTPEERADFIARLCSAWDFGILPLPETIAEVRRPEWREAVDRCRLLTSHTYHLLRHCPISASCRPSCGTIRVCHGCDAGAHPLRGGKRESTVTASGISVRLPNGANGLSGSGMRSGSATT